jgi:hypothetical protein
MHADLNSAENLGVKATVQIELPEPWEGRNYQKTRLLLLGESAYSWMEDGEIVHPSSRHAHEAVEWLLNDPKAFGTFPFMTKLSRGLAAEEWPSRERLRAVWSEAAFANYVPDSVGLGAGNRPSSEHWRKARAHWPHLLDRLRPRVVIVLGKDLWRNMPEADFYLLDDVQAYRLSTGEWAMCWAINHPASRRNAPSWMRLAQFIKFARDREIYDTRPEADKVARHYFKEANKAKVIEGCDDLLDARMAEEAEEEAERRRAGFHVVSK